MAKDRNGILPEDASGGGSPAASSRSDRHSKSKRKKDDTFDDDSTDSGDHRKRRRRSRSSRSKRESRKRRRRDSSDDSDDSDSDSSSESDSDESDSGTSDSDARRRRRRREKESDKERRRRKEKERERERRRRKEKGERRRKKEKKKKKEKGMKGAVTNSWGKYGIIRETDMWNKRPEFTAWLAEVKQMNLETLGNKEEKQLFKDFMEDHNTATFPSKKYYDLDTYHRRQLEKEMKKGLNKVKQIERMVFNDEEQRRQELLKEREKHKEEQVEALKRSMQSGMAQAMKEQSRLREEMAYQYKLGNFEAAAAIQRRLDPDAAP